MDTGAMSAILSRCGLGIALAAWALAVGCGESDGTRSQVPRQACPAGPPFAERWLGQMLGGPTDGPVTVAVGRDPNEHGLPASPARGGRYLLTKVLLAVAAPPGTLLEIRGAERETGAAMGFTHLDRSRREGEAIEPGPSIGEVPDRGQGTSGVADIPGYVLVEEPGCFRFTVAVGGRVGGPFYLRLG